MIRIRLIGFASLMGAALAVPLQGKGVQGQQDTSGSYTLRVVASGLGSPTELRLAGDQTLFIAQQPKAPRDASLARLDLISGELTLLGTGAAVLSGFTANREGRLYWVDGPKGALLTQGSPKVASSVIHKGPALPATTLAVDASDRVYVARAAPLKNGADTAAVLVRGSSLVPLPDPGGPVKTALVATAGGDLYWTSSQEGVIYHVSPDGRGNVVLAGLDKPQGLALDAAEDTLYWTEVPTPGIAGENGGRNTVSALDLGTLGRSVIQRGDPQPTGVAVASNGTVYWTSTSRGLVVAAVPVQAAVAPAQFAAMLTGADEVPPVTTPAQGLATFNLGTSTGEDSAVLSSLTYQLSVSNLGSSVRRVEIHQGARGVVGPLVATLSRGENADDDHGSTAGFSARGRLRLRDLRGPFAGDWTGFTGALAGGGLYVNVLTRSNPTGAVRGQIVPPNTPGNQAPSATITTPPANVTIQAGQSVNFAGTATDPNGDAVTVLWDFGDGTTATSLTPGNHSFPVVGTYAVRLTATDANGLADPNPPTRTITVQPVVVNQPPDATIVTPDANVTLTAGQSVSFTGIASDPNGDVVTVLWNFGDGSTSALLAPGAHTYTTAGTFTVTLTATDSHGLADPTPATRTITVQAVTVNGPPNGTITAPAANVTINAGQSVAFTATTTDPNGNPVTVLWNFGDGASSTLLAPGNHTYTTAGTFTVTLTATDSLGLADPTPDTRMITVSPVVAAATLTQLQTTIFTPLCIGCHSVGGSAGMNLSAGSAFSNLVNVPATTLPGLRVVPGSPSTSALVTQLASGHRSVSAANQALISSWITGGALNN